MNPKDAGVDRRGFCRGALLGGIWAAGLLTIGAPWVRRSRAATPDLAAVQGPSAPATRRAVELLGGMRRFVRPGAKVVVKPNIGFDRVPEQAANTNPDVVAEVVRMALEAGAAEVRIFDHTSHEASRCYRSSGVERAVAAIGDRRVRLLIPDPQRYVDVRIRGGARLSSWPFYEDAVRADVFINCPVAKQHVLSGLTMGLKNMMGAIGGRRSDIHDGFEDKIVDLNLARSSHLTVLDATRILRAHGPEGGSLLDVARPGIVVAGANVVAVDAYGTRFFGMKPGEVPAIRRAADRGLGPIDPLRGGLREEAL